MSLTAQQRSMSSRAMARPPSQPVSAEETKILMPQRRKRPIIACDSLWSLFRPGPAPFPEVPSTAVPFMDPGISPDYEVQGNRERRRQLALRDASLATPSAAAALSIDGYAALADPLPSTTQATQAAVWSAVANSRRAQLQSGNESVGSTIGRRCMPERVRSQIQFGWTTLETDFLNAEEASVSRMRRTSSAASHQRPPSQLQDLTFAKRSASSMGTGLQPQPVMVERPPAAFSPNFNLKKATWNQEEVINRRDRDLSFATIRRIPRPVHRDEKQSVLILR